MLVLCNSINDIYIYIIIKLIYALYDPCGYMFLANYVSKYHLCIRERIDAICRLVTHSFTG
jgi:hypothetical protein